MKNTSFDKYLDAQLMDPAFAARFKRAGEAWNAVLAGPIFLGEFPKIVSDAIPKWHDDLGCIFSGV